jgi:hypothetical protein
MRIAAVRVAARGGAHSAIDMAGQASDPNATLASLHSLRRARQAGDDGQHDDDFPLPTVISCNHFGNHRSIYVSNWECAQY